MPPESIEVNPQTDSVKPTLSLEEDPKPVFLTPGVKLPVAADPASKRSQKRQRKAEEALEKRKAQKKQRREDLKEKKKELREKAESEAAEKCAGPGVKDARYIVSYGAGVCRSDLSPEENELLAATARKTRAERKKQEREEFLAKTPNGCKILIDCAWEDFMTDKERNSLCSQLMYCFAVNKGAEQPSEVILSGLGPKMLSSLSKMQGSDNWMGFHRVEGCCLTKKFLKSSSDLTEAVSSGIQHGEVAPKTSSFDLFSHLDSLSTENTVYLTADTENVLKEFDPSKTYVIGGVVDRNRLKNCTREKADYLGIPCAKLPIDEFATEDYGTFSRVLTVNHVAEIILKYQSTKDWEKAIETVIPKRRVGCGKAFVPTSQVGPSADASGKESEEIQKEPESEEIPLKKDDVKSAS